MLTRLLHLHLDKIIDGRIAGPLLEEAGEAGGAVIVAVAERVQGNIVVDMFLHKEDGAVDAVDLLRGGSNKMLLIIDKEGDKMGQAHIRKEQVIDTISELERLVDLAEKGDHLIAAPNGIGLEM